jgi:zinc transporter 1/2/3
LCDCSDCNIETNKYLQLLAPANEALTDECLTGPITEYPWVEGICLMSVFILFFVELMVMRFARFGESHDHNDIEHQPATPDSSSLGYRDETPPTKGMADIAFQPAEIALQDAPHANERRASAHVPGDDHLSHIRTHPNDDHSKPALNIPQLLPTLY